MRSGPAEPNERRTRRIILVLASLIGLWAPGRAGEKPSIEKQFEEQLAHLRGRDKAKADAAAKWLSVQAHMRTRGPDLQRAAPALLDAAARWPEVHSFASAASRLQCPRNREALVVKLLGKATRGGKVCWALQDGCSDPATSIFLLLGSLGSQGRQSLSVLSKMLRNRNCQESAIIGIIRAGAAGRGLVPSLRTIARRKEDKDSRVRRSPVLAAIALANLNYRRREMLDRVIELRAQPYHLTYLVPCTFSPEMIDFLKKGNSQQARMALYALSTYLDMSLTGHHTVVAGGRYWFCPAPVVRDPNGLRNVLRFKDEILRRSQEKHEPDKQTRLAADWLLRAIAAAEGKPLPRKPEKPKEPEKPADPGDPEEEPVKPPEDPDEDF
jgi:hypothetical protein